MTEEAARNELAAVRLLLRIPDGVTVIGFLRESRTACTCANCPIHSTPEYIAKHEPWCHAVDPECNCGGDRS